MDSGKYQQQNKLYELTNEILEAINNKVMVCGIFCDLENAFDCVNHKILLSQPEYYTMTGKAQRWFESYFQNGYQGVRNYKR